MVFHPKFVKSSGALSHRCFPENGSYQMFIIIIVSFKSAILFDHTVHAGKKINIYIFFPPFKVPLKRDPVISKKKKK